MFNTIKKCPLCKSTKVKRIIYNQKNVYSFLISKILKVKENDLIKKLYNVECRQCFIIYKKKWVSKKTLRQLYNKCMPIHPACLNKNSNNFSKKNFKKLSKQIIKNISNPNKEKNDRLKREIIKILNAVNSKNKVFVKSKKDLIRYLKNDEIYKIQKEKMNIIKFIDKPKNYSQFSGYGNQEIWNYLIKSTNLKRNSKYAELGCPSWGMFKYASHSGLDKFFLNYKNNNFFNCIFRLDKSIKKKKLEKKLIYDFLGIFNYIDHIENMNSFFKDITKISKYIGIITAPYFLASKIDCQHFTCFQKKTFIYLKNKFKLKLCNEPFKLENTKNYFYIFKNEV